MASLAHCLKVHKVPKADAKRLREIFEDHNKAGTEYPTETSVKEFIKEITLERDATIARIQQLGGDVSTYLEQQQRVTAATDQLKAAREEKAAAQPTDTAYQPTTEEMRGTLGEPAPEQDRAEFMEQRKAEQLAEKNAGQPQPKQWSHQEVVAQNQELGKAKAEPQDLSIAQWQTPAAMRKAEAAGIINDPLMWSETTNDVHQKEMDKPAAQRNLKAVREAQIEEVSEAIQSVVSKVETKSPEVKRDDLQREKAAEKAIEQKKKGEPAKVKVFKEEDQPETQETPWDVPQQNQKVDVSEELTQEQIEDRAVEQARVKAASDKVIPPGDINTVYDATKWTRLKENYQGEEVVMYLQGSGIIMRRGTDNYNAFQKDAEGKRINRGRFYTLGAAKAAMADNLTAEEYYGKEENLPKKKAEQETKKKDKAAAEKLTKDQEALVETVNEAKFVKKWMAVAANIDKTLYQDTGLEGKLFEALLRAARQFDPEKQVKRKGFETFANDLATGTIKDYRKAKIKAAIQEQGDIEVTTEEGSSPATAISQSSTGVQLLTDTEGRAISMKDTPEPRVLEYSGERFDVYHKDGWWYHGDKRVAGTLDETKAILKEQATPKVTRVSVEDYLKEKKIAAEKNLAKKQKLKSAKDEKIVVVSPFGKNIKKVTSKKALQQFVKAAIDAKGSSYRLAHAELVYKELVAQYRSLDKKSKIPAYIEQFKDDMGAQKQSKNLVNKAPATEPSPVTATYESIMEGQMGDQISDSDLRTWRNEAKTEKIVARFLKQNPDLNAQDIPMIWDFLRDEIQEQVSWELENHGRRVLEHILNTSDIAYREKYEIAAVKKELHFSERLRRNSRTKGSDFLKQHKWGNSDVDPKERRRYDGVVQMLLEVFPEELNELYIYRRDFLGRGTPPESGHYNSGTHQIQLTNGWYDHKTVLHEVIHAVTARRIYSSKQYRNEVTEIFKEYVLQAKDDKYAYGHTNIIEFMAEAMSNPKFQARLEAIPSKQTSGSILDRLKNFIRSIFGPRVQGTLMQDVINLTFEVAPNRNFKQRVKYEMGEVVNSDARKAKLAMYHQMEQDLYNSLPAKLRDAMDDIAELGSNARVDQIIDKIGVENWFKIEEAKERHPHNRRIKILDQMDVSIPGEGATPSFSPQLINKDTAVGDRDRKKTTEERVAIMEANSKMGRPIDLGKEWFKNLGKDISKMTKSMTEVLRGINPKLLRPVLKMEANIREKNVMFQRMVQPFIDIYRKMPKKDKLLLDLSLMNAENPAYREDRDRIIKKYKMTNAWYKVESVLSEINGLQKQVALDTYGKKRHYYPRRVNDITGLMQAIKEDPEYGVIQAQLDGLGEDATQADRENAVKQMIHTGRFPALALLDPTSARKRKINTVSSEWKHFYENSDDALINHIYESTEAIYARKFFGDVNRVNMVKKIHGLYESLEKSTGSLETKQRIVAEINLMEIALNNYTAEQEFEDGISDLLVKLAPTMNYKDQRIVVDAIRARLTQKGMTGRWSTIRNISLMSVLASPTSAITQIGDLAFSIFSAGLINTIASIPGIGDNLISTKDLDLSHSMKEFQSQGTARALDKVLKWSGLQFMDQIGKTTTMNAQIKRAKKLSLTEFTKEYEDVLGRDTAITWKHLRQNKKTKEAKFFAFQALAKFQPISLSEMPVGYLQAGNGRIFYALKSYNIKAVNNLYRELVHGYRTAETPAQKRAAGKNFGKLLMLMTFAGATADELKDWLLGKDAGTFSDNVWENVLKIGLMSRYTLEKGVKGDLVGTIIEDVLMPPTGWLGDPVRDAFKIIEGEPDFKTLQNLPWGKLPYAWFSPTEEKSDMKNLREQIIRQYADGQSLGALFKQRNAYNAWARKNDATILTPGKIHKAAANLED